MRLTGTKAKQTPLLHWRILRRSARLGLPFRPARQRLGKELLAVELLVFPPGATRRRAMDQSRFQQEIQQQQSAVRLLRQGR